MEQLWQKRARYVLRPCFQRILPRSVISFNARTQVSNAFVGRSELLLDFDPAVVQLQHVFLRLQQYLGYLSLLFRRKFAILCSVTACLHGNCLTSPRENCRSDGERTEHGRSCARSTATAVQMMPLHGAAMHVVDVGQSSGAYMCDTMTFWLLHAAWTGWSSRLALELT